MKLKELNEQVAKACDTTPQAVAAVHAETFRLIAQTLDKGERVFVPDFGVFSVKDVDAAEGQPAKKIVRFRQRGGEENGQEEGAKERRKRAKDADASAEKEPAKAGE